MFASQLWLIYVMLGCAILWMIHVLIGQCKITAEQWEIAHELMYQDMSDYYHDLRPP